MALTTTDDIDWNSTQYSLNYKGANKFKGNIKKVTNTEKFITPSYI